MKITILGNNGPYPAVDGACSGYLLTSDSGNTNILIDCGTGVLSQLLSCLDLKQLDAVVLSHLHYDHMSDMLPMQYALQFHPRTPLKVLLPNTPGTVRKLLEISAYDLSEIQDTHIGEFCLSFAPARHPVECYALRAECDGHCLGYTGDTNEFPGLETFFKDVDVLLADAGMLDADWSQSAPHLSARGCAELANAANAQKLLLTHRNPRYEIKTLEDEARSVRADAQFVRIGQQLKI